MGRPRKDDADRARDYLPVGVRLDPVLREVLKRHAAINGRSLNQEVLVRLRDSVAGDAAPHAAYRPLPAVAEPAAAAPVLSDDQRMLLTRFRALAPDKQLALLALLAP